MLNFRNTFNKVEVKRHARLVKAQDLIKTYIQKNTPKSKLIKEIFEEKIEHAQIRRGDAFIYKVQTSDSILSDAISLCMNCVGILEGEVQIDNIGVCNYRLYNADRFTNLECRIPYEM